MIISEKMEHLDSNRKILFSFNAKKRTQYCLIINILPHDFRLQTSASEGCPLHTPPPTSVKAFVLVFVRVPSPQVVEHPDQALQEAQVQSIAEIQRNVNGIRGFVW